MTNLSHANSRALYWMGGALFSFCGMAVAARELAASLGTFEILFWRGLVGIVIIAALLWRSGFGQIKTRQFRWHLFRNLFHFWGQASWVYAIGAISLAEVFAIEFTTPIWTVLLASLFLSERLTWIRSFSLMAGFIGVLIILRPGAQLIEPAALVMLAGTFGFALSFITTKKLIASESPLNILFYMTLIQLPISLGLSLADWTWPGLAIWPYILVVSGCALSAHYCIARALLLAEASLVVPMDFMRLPLIAVIGLLLYGEPLDLWVFVGAGVIFFGAYLNLRHDKAS